MTADGHCGPLGATLSHYARSAGAMDAQHDTEPLRRDMPFGRKESRRVPLCQLCHLCHEPALAQRRGRRATVDPVQRTWLTCADA